MQTLKESFQKYIKEEVLELVELDNMGLQNFLVARVHISSEIFYVGLPPKKFPDFAKLTQHILDGGLLHEIAKTDPPLNFTLQSEAPAASQKSSLQTGTENM